MALTKKEHLINPEVLANIVQYELKDNIVFAPLATVDTTLVGQAGDTITVPKYEYIGDATDVAEGEEIPTALLTAVDSTMTIKSAGRGVEITDQAVNSGYGDPVGEAGRQLRLAITNKVDNDLLTALQTATQTSDAGVDSVEGLEAALDLFSHENAGRYVLVTNPKDGSRLRKDARTIGAGSDVMADALINGTRFDVLGVEVVFSNKLEEGEAYLIQEGALALIMKQNITFEDDRDASRRVSEFFSYMDYGTYLYDDSKVVKLSTGTAGV